MGERSGSNVLESISATGLTVVHEPDKPAIDVVFVHGFTGHPERTWTHKKGNNQKQDQRNNDNSSDALGEPQSKFRRLRPFSRSPNEAVSSRTAIYWPRDLLPASFPQARVLTYGYDTHMRHVFGPPVNKTTVYDIAWDFLVELEASRRSDPRRPLFFIAHSLGGIIVKELLRQASVSQTFRQHEDQPRPEGVFNTTLGIIFFGTPHGGADPRGFLQKVVEVLVKSAGFSANEQVINALLPSSERLRQLRDEFNPIAHRQNWMIHSFQEGLGIPYLNGKKVVEDPSSYLNFPSLETTQHINRNHMDMCRFTGFNDTEYVKVLAALVPMLRIVATSVARPQPQIETMNDRQRRAMIQALEFEQIDSRQMSVKAAYADTCKWVLSHSEFLKWLDKMEIANHHGFLWIKGNPGTGKSTVMKFLLSHFRDSADLKQKTVISFFFHARGDDLEKSAIGMYRSLLRQLLIKIPQLQSVFESHGFTYWRTGGETWSVEFLKDIFGHAISQLGDRQIVCLIDALDECHHDQIRDLVAFFQRIGRGAVSGHFSFQTILSSRHYPHISIPKGIILVLEKQDEHKKDIATYISEQLSIENTRLAKEVREDIGTKARGVFMWVVLVVEILNREHDEGRTASRIQQKLKDIPNDLESLFSDILHKNLQNRAEVLLCLQWVLFARRPLSPKELYFAILSGTELEQMSEWEKEDASIEHVKRFILSCSRGLVEVTSSEIPTAQFIHESVRDFLLKNHELSEDWPDLGRDSEGKTHETLRICCWKYLKAVMSSQLQRSLPKQLPHPYLNGLDLRVLFLPYATTFLLTHAEYAARGGQCQREFLQSFGGGPEWQQWLEFRDYFHPAKFAENASVLYVLAQEGYHSLIRVVAPGPTGFEVEDAVYKLPFFAAIASRSVEAVQEILNRSKDVQALQSSPIVSLWRRYLARRLEEPSLVADGRERPTDGLTKLPLYYTATYGDKDLIRLLLDSGKVQINDRDMDGRSAMCHAAQAGQADIIRMLLSYGANPEVKDLHFHMTPLGLAARQGNEEAVRLLLDHGADIEARDKHFAMTPLHTACQHGHKSVAQLLIDYGADIETRDGHFCMTPARIAAVHSHEGIAELIHKISATKGAV